MIRTEHALKKLRAEGQEPRLVQERNGPEQYAAIQYRDVGQILAIAAALPGWTLEFEFGSSTVAMSCPVWALVDLRPGDWVLIGDGVRHVKEGQLEAHYW